jgi:hypothetical protein
MNNCRICWFFTHILRGILIFKGLTVRRLCKSFGVEGLTCLRLLCRYSAVQCHYSNTHIDGVEYLFGLTPVSFLTPLRH